MRRSVTVGLLALGVLGGAIGYAAYEEWAPPTVDAGESRAVLPAIDRYLTSDRTGLLSDRSGTGPVTRPGVTTVCTERIIEIRRSGGDLRVGLAADCGDYGRRGGTLVMGTGGASAAEFTVSAATDLVTAAAYEPDDAPPSWFAAHFSTAGADEFQRWEDGSGAVPDSAVRARTLLGLPSSAPFDRDDTSLLD